MPSFIILVNVYGKGQCGCPSFQERSTEHCEDSDERTILNIPRWCPKGFKLFNQRKCLPLVKTPDIRSVMKRVFVTNFSKDFRAYLKIKRQRG